MGDGDLLVFYGGMRPIHRVEHNLIYALIGLYVVEEVVRASDVTHDHWFENAHVRKKEPGAMDIVVRAKPKLSGRFDRCIPIGEWRAGAYRVRQDIIELWGGLSVKDGFIQRSAVPPAFHKPERFLAWFEKHKIQLLPRNN